MNPERAALFAQDSSERGPRRPEPDHARGRGQPPADVMESVNPARAALIDDRKDGVQMPPGRLPRDETRDRGPRQPSPGRPRYGQDQGPSHKILEVDPEETLVTDHRSPAQASGVNDQLSAKAMLEAPWNLCAMPLISPVRGLAARIQKGDCLIKTRTTEG